FTIIRGGILTFGDNSTAANATFTTDYYGRVEFGTGNAGNGTFTNNRGGQTIFLGSASAENGTFIARGGTADVADGGEITFFSDATAANGTFLINGSAASGASGGLAVFNDHSTSDNATLIANGGVESGEGGVIQFADASKGVTSRVEVFGNGSLDISEHNPLRVRIGSLEGDGFVFLGTLELVVGTNGLSTTFSGVIQ